MADLAGRGVHRPEERPFLTPWTDGSPLEVSRFVLQNHWQRLGSWTVESWNLGLAIFRGGRPLGMLTMRASGFPLIREVSTGSWLGLAHHGMGYGTEARQALLTLAFDHLGTEAALCGVFQDNIGSQRVSRKLGYEPDGITRDARGSEVLVSDRLRLTRQAWTSRPTPDVTVTGMDACASLFGL